MSTSVRVLGDREGGEDGYIVRAQKLEVRVKYFSLKDRNKMYIW